MPSNTATLSDFEALLEAAAKQEEPQRLLFVFAQKHLDEQATPAQRETFSRGQGGHLQPCLCVDKTPSEVPSFAALRAESEHTGISWDILFVSSLSGRGGIAPNSDEADQPLRFMVAAVNDGRVKEMAAFDHNGHTLRFA
ncbi:MAG: ribonucleotide reductase subunit alpha [Candidimonas sp.]|nr:MAG: ribonucleotide reductase subunit alpha [Candidimonas sp.]